jgi:cobalt-zinc-cadmium efflux system membrane fusion protein
MKNSPKQLIASMPVRTAVVTASLVIGGLLAFSSSHSGESDKAQADKPMWTVQDNKVTVPTDSPLRKRLVIAPVGTLVPAHGIELPGVVEADPAAMINVNPPLTGKLTELRVKLGDTVKAGQVLAVISSPDMAQAWSDQEKARDALDLAKRALDRGTGVNSAGANAAKDLEQLKSSYNQALAESRRADDRLKTLGAGKDGKPGPLTLSAPVSGTVTAINSGVGSFLNDPTATLMSIANLDHVWVIANVPENMVSAVRTGQTAEVRLDAWPDSTWSGKVSTVSAVLESDTHRNKVRISFKNSDGRLKPNMYANVRLAVIQNSKLTIPTSALLMNNDSITVFVEVAPWIFQRRIVTVGSEDGEQVSVVSGLNAGDRIITRGGVLIND